MVKFWTLCRFTIDSYVAWNIVGVVSYLGRNIFTTKCITNNKYVTHASVLKFWKYLDIFKIQSLVFSICISYFYSTPVGERNIAISFSVCVCVCLSVCVCPRAYILNHWTDFHEICYADLLWPWLGPLLAALRYVMYFWVYRWRHVWP